MWPFKKKMKHVPGRKGEEIRAVVEGRGAALQVESGKGYRIGRYVKDGAVDFETYRRVQDAGNRLKIDRIYAVEELITQIAIHARDTIEVSGVLCHGTRNGAELRWFSKNFPPSVEVLGTDIAESASQFDNTIQWDFHEFREDWRDRWSIIYSNSWDHSTDPQRMFSTWAECLHAGGLLYLEHNSDSLDIDELDLFGATAEALTGFVLKGSGGKLRSLATIDAARFGSPRQHRQVLVFQRT